MLWRGRFRSHFSFFLVRPNESKSTPPPHFGVIQGRVLVCVPMRTALMRMLWRVYSQILNKIHRGLISIRIVRGSLGQFCRRHSTDSEILRRYYIFGALGASKINMQPKTKRTMQAKFSVLSNSFLKRLSVLLTFVTLWTEYRIQY